MSTTTPTTTAREALAEHLARLLVVLDEMPAEDVRALSVTVHCTSTEAVSLLAGLTGGEIVHGTSTVQSQQHELKPVNVSGVALAGSGGPRLPPPPAPKER